MERELDINKYESIMIFKSAFVLEIELTVLPVNQKYIFMTSQVHFITIP